MPWDTAALLRAIRQRGRIPDEDENYTDASLLLEADWQLQETFAPVILSVRSEYYTRSEDFPIVSGTAGYPIPARCIASVPRMVYYVERHGRTYPLPWVPLADKLRFEGRQGAPLHHTIQDDQILLLPPPGTTHGTLRIEYEYRYGRLVMPDEAPAASAIAAGVVSAATPAEWSTADRFDLIRAEPPFTLLVANLTATAIDPGVSITFDAGDLPDRFEVGDYVCLAEESPVPQIPANGHPVLALAVAKEVLDEMGDPHGQRYAQKLGGAIERFKRQLAPREKGAQQKITSPNSALRRRGRRRWHYGAPS